MKIESVYYFDYSGKIGYCQSIRDFRAEEMTYIELAISTPKITVNAEPTKFKLNAEDSKKVREFVIVGLDSLKEISEILAENSPKYIMVSFADGSKLFYEYNSSFCSVFDIKSNYTEKIRKNETISQFAIDTKSTENSQFHNIVAEKKDDNNYQKSYYKNEQKKKSPLMRFFVGVLIFIFFLVGMSVAFIKPDSYDDTEIYTEEKTLQETPVYDTLVPVNEPVSGTMLYGYEVYDGSEITINASKNDACVVKLKNWNNEDVLSFYVRAGDSITVGVPREEFYVYFASGSTWYGDEYLFGEDTSYSMDDEIFDLYNYNKGEYTLYSVSNGNFQQTPIDASEF